MSTDWLQILLENVSTGWSKSPLTFESAAASSSEGEVGRARYGMLERSMGI